MGRHTHALITVAILALTITRVASDEQQQPSATPVEFHIAPQPLAQALNAWAQQSGLQLIWPAGDVARIQSRSLYGKYEPMQALALLLENSGLKYSVLSEGTITVGEPISSTPTAVSAKGRSD